ncbi:MAG: GntR family transcriptional regulator [Blastococcus sp.]|jgi:GntR family transcriptional regulator|nr:GntR family transcriptional regulator [Blastococcus sp.]
MSRAAVPTAVAHAIDKGSAVPFYRQLKDILRADITGRGLRSGDRLPGDHELCQQYGVSRPVVRQALSELQYEGVLQRIKGRGTFVAPQLTSQSLVQALTGLHDDVHAMGRTLLSEVRTLKVTAADPDVAGRLEIPVGTAVVVTERLRFVDDEPWVYAISHVPAALAPDLVDQDLREQSLYALLERRYGLRLVRSRRSVEAHVAGQRLAGDLRIPRHAPVLKLINVSFGADNRPVETFVAYHRGDRSRFEVELERAPGGRAVPPLVRVV